MADTEGFSYIISISLSLIEKHEKEYVVLLNNSEPRDCIFHFKLLLQSLETFYSISNEDLKRSISEVIENVMQELQSLSGRPIDEDLVNYLKKAYDELGERVANVVWDPETDNYGIIVLNAYHKTTYNFVFKSLGELSCSKVDPNALYINEKLLLLQTLFEYIGDTGIDITVENADLFGPLVELIYGVADLLNSCLVGEKDEDMELEMMVDLYYLLEEKKFMDICWEILRSSKLKGFNKELVESKIYLLDRVMELLNYTSNSSNIDLNDVFEKLNDKIYFLETILADLPHEVIIKYINDLAPFLENMTYAALHILYLCYGEKMQEEMFDEVNDALENLIGQIEDIQAEAADIELYNDPKTNVAEITLFNFPKIDRLGFLDFFLGHVEELLKCQPELIKFLKNEIQTLRDEFDSLRSLLKQITEKEDFEDVQTQIIQLAYQAEHVIDSYLVKSFPNSYIKFTLSKVLEKSKLIKSEMTRMNDVNKNISQPETIGKISINVPSQAVPITIDKVVGFEDEAEKIMEFLFGDTKKRDVISIVGLPGLGKTTLTWKIFEDPLVIDHFDVRAWCTVSQTYRKREVLLTILGDSGRTEEIKKLNDEELVEKLYKSLKGRRYLIVIDDLWNIEDWNDLARPFPDDKNKSRIIITSRLHNVASQTKVNSKVHLLREFSENESWELFEKKLFQNNLFQKKSFPEEFQDVGKKIVESCKRLPLAIVVIASLLSNEKSVDMWKEIAANLRSRILSESESHCKAIFELSYIHLPDQLKSCLLYLGAFEEDEEIPLLKLKQLWIAEGIVRDIGRRNLEDLAEEYCLDLINRSLVTPTKERSLGGVKTCRVHDLVHEYCLEKAQEESFLQVIYNNDWQIFSSIYDLRRLRINSDALGFFEQKPYGRSVRSLFSSTKINYFVTLSLFFKNFKLLRVLDLGGVYIEEYFCGIDILIHLRYLAIKAKVESIPSSISNLWNLQFFIFEKSDSAKVSVPDSLWDMVHLRNVRINDFASFEVHSRRLSNSVLLDNLDTLATPYLCYGEDADNLLKRLPKLRKLSCVFYIKDPTTKLPKYPALDFLHQLMSLKLTFRGQGPLQEKNIELKFPSNLKKVTLMHFQGCWDDISRMGKILPNLEVLKLYGASRNDDIWVLEDENFPRLKYLKLYWCHFKEWISSEDSFPALEKLVLNDCHYLKEIPSYFGDLTALEMISVHECNQSLCDSVREVQEDQEEYGNSKLKVFITQPKKNDKL